MADKSDLMKAEELAAELKMSPGTLENWRYLGIGPPYIKLSQTRVRYSRKAVDHWLEKRTTAPEGAA